MSVFRPIIFDDLAYAADPSVLAPISLGQAGLPALRTPRHHAAVKRAADVVLATAALVAMALPMLMIAALLKLRGDGPVLFRQERIGLHNQPFTMLKFRTMRAQKETRGICRQATRGDPRITQFGGFLRRTSLDELPQLFNVLAGSMSLVGPRPHAPGTCAAGQSFESLCGRYAERHCVKPGITGLAQVRGWRGETDTAEKLLHRIDSDLEYIATWSLPGDLLIIARTIVTVMRMLNAY